MMQKKLKCNPKAKQPEFGGGSRESEREEVQGGAGGSILDL